MHASQLEAGQFPAYGAAGPQMYDLGRAAHPKPARRSLNFVSLVLGFFVPVVVFSVVYFVRAFQIAYDDPGLAGLVTAGMLGLVLFTGYLAFAAYRKQGDGMSSPLWYGFVFATGLLAWIVAFAAGNANFITNMRPYFD